MNPPLLSRAAKPTDLFLSRAENEPESPEARLWSVVTTGDRGNPAQMFKEITAAVAELVRGSPLDMVLFCPSCGVQHVDAWKQCAPCAELDPEGNAWCPQCWTNPPHRSHLCAACGFQWRPADIATNGVLAVKTKGADDSPPLTREPEKYDDVLLPFLALMRRELHANTRKGDRPGWLRSTPNAALLEVYWHAAKLSAAVKNADNAAIQEHSADVANMAMMVLDVCGGLAPVT